jgi:cell wall-associated NlpC family hydrolase
MSDAPTVIAPQTYRQRFLDAMHDLVGKPVLWGAKGPDAVDCSGSVSVALVAIGGPDFRDTVNAQGYHDRTRPLRADEAPLPGDLAFYGLTGPTDIEHVAVIKEDGGVISADGATSHIDPRVLGFEAALSRALANPANRVRLHNTPKYRSDTKFIVVHRNTIVDRLDGVSR